MITKLFATALIAGSLTLTGLSQAQAQVRDGSIKEVGTISLGGTLVGDSNRIIVSRAYDPDYPNVYCLFTRYKAGGVFPAGAPSNGSISCRAIGPVRLDVSKRTNDVDVFTRKLSRFGWKSQKVRRMIDEEAGIIHYVLYSKKPMDGSVKHSVSSVVATRE